MTSLVALSAAAERIDCLLLAEGAPAICVGDLRDEVVQLISDLKSLVLSGESVEHTDHLLTQLAYAIEDSVESYAVKESQTSRRKSSVLFRHFSKRSATRKLREEIHVFRRNIDEHKHSFPVRTAGMGAVKTAIASSDRRPERQLVTSSSRVNRHITVGMDMDRKDVMDFLMDGGSRLSIIAICGMGGLGKTTLAKLVFDDKSVVQDFHIRAWAVVSQDFQFSDIIETILRSSSSGWNTNKIAGRETVGLMEVLYKYLFGRRYLIVLDDVWSAEVWDSIKRCFPDNNSGSRVVITTRLADVAAIAGGRVLQMRLLTEEESWELFKIKSGLKDLGTEQNPQIEMTGKQIVSQCRGLPLAITTIGGMLWGKKLEDWDSVLHVFQELLDITPYQNPDLNVLTLSYNHLPFHLKPCFLYLGLFPPDHDIPLEKLYLLWMAEGLISMTPLNNKRRMEVAEDYLKEMVNRSLVMVEKEEVSASIKSSNSCTIHDLLRDLCILKGKEERFLEIIDLPSGNKISTLTRKVAIDLNKFAGGNEILINLPEPLHIRSILFFDTQSLPKPEWPREVLDLKEFHRTRVLDFDGVDFRVKNLLRGVEKLIYLRYLGFRGCYLRELPSTLSNFPFLETLDLRVRVSCTMTIPNILNKLTSLRHLYFPLSFRCNTNEKFKLDRLKNLETLENFHAGVCDANDLLQLENLQILTGFVDGNSRDRNSMDLKKIINSMTANEKLSKSSLVVKKFDSYSEKRFSIVSDLLKCNSLQFLEIEGYLGKLPHREAIGSNFTEIIFDESEFKEDPMPTLGKLPNLKSLVLCNDAFVGTKMVCSESDFSKLKYLKLAALQYLEEWEVDFQCMPSLIRLTIEQCDKLIELCNGFVDIPIGKFMIGSMPIGFQETVKRIIKERMEYGEDEIEAIFYDC